MLPLNAHRAPRTAVGDSRLRAFALMATPSARVRLTASLNAVIVTPHHSRFSAKCNSVFNSYQLALHRGRTAGMALGLAAAALCIALCFSTPGAQRSPPPPATADVCGFDYEPQLCQSKQQCDWECQLATCRSAAPAWCIAGCRVASVPALRGSRTPAP